MHKKTTCACKTCAGYIRAWISTWLLSSGISGRCKLAYEPESNSNRYRAILSGRTESLWYWPYSPQSPRKICSHFTASYPILWLPPPARRWVIRVLFIARIHIWHLMPETSWSSPSITFSGGVRCQRSALNGVSWPVLGLYCVHASDPYPASPSSILAVKEKKKNEKYAQYAQLYYICTYMYLRSIYA